METVKKYVGLKIPTWALSYLVNADDSGLSEKEKQMVDSYMKVYEDIADFENGSYIFSIETYQQDFEDAEDCLITEIEYELNSFDGEIGGIVWDRLINNVVFLKRIKDEYKEPYFTWSPEFGLPCDVQDCTILIVK